MLGVHGAGVADGDGSILLEEELGDREADDVATADDDGVLSCDGDASALQHLDDTHGGAGGEEGVLALQVEESDVDGVEAVGVLMGVDNFESLGLINVLGEGELHQHSVALGVVVQHLDLILELLLGGGVGELDLDGVESTLHGSLVLEADIGLGVLSLTADDDSEAGGLDVGLLGGNVGDGVSDLGTDGLGNGLAVNQAERHKSSAENCD